MAMTPRPSKSKNGKLRRIVIEPAENGFVIECEYKSGPKEPCCPEPVRKVAKDLDDLYEILSSKLS